MNREYGESSGEEASEASRAGERERDARVRPPPPPIPTGERLPSETLPVFAASRGSRVGEVTRLGGGFADEPNTTPTRAGGAETS